MFIEKSLQEKLFCDNQSVFGIKLSTF